MSKQTIIELRGIAKHYMMGSEGFLRPKRH